MAHLDHISSSTRCMLFFVLIFSILVQHQVSSGAPAHRPVTDCKCTAQTIYDGNLGREVGNCLVQDPHSHKYYCYVRYSTGCYDKRESSRATGLYWSYYACELQGRDGGGAAAGAPSAPDYNYKY